MSHSHDNTAMERYCDGMIAPRTRRQLTQLGASLRRARNEAGLTQDQLGDLAGVSRQLGNHGPVWQADGDQQRDHPNQARCGCRATAGA